jgi:hypothetical protein
MTFDNIFLEGKDSHGLENQFSKEVNLHEQKKTPISVKRREMGVRIQSLAIRVETTGFRHGA